MTVERVRRGVLLGVIAALLLGSGVALATDSHDLRLRNLDGDKVDPFAGKDAAAVEVFVFMRTDCPICNRYAPEIRRLHDELVERDVDVWLVYPNPDVTVSKIREHLNEYDLPFPALRDPHHDLVKMTGVSITPEAAVYVDDGQKMVYRGRIDDRYVAFGKTRAEARTHDLRQAIEEAHDGEPVRTPRTHAVGCFIADLG